VDKQKLILDAALKLFVEYGFHGTPTSKIAQEAGVANGTLFHYYKTKDDLVVGLYNEIRSELSEATSSITHESEFITPKFKNIFIHTLYWALNNKEKFYYLQQFHISPHAAKISNEAILQQDQVQTKLIAEGIRKKLMRQIPAELIFTMFNSQLFSIYQYLTSAEFTQEEQERIINETYQMTWELFKYN